MNHLRNDAWAFLGANAEDMDDREDVLGYMYLKATSAGMRMEVGLSGVIR